MLRWFIMCACVLLCVASMARADGLIIIHDPPSHIPGHFRFAPLEVRYHRVDVEIDGEVATTSIEQEFFNASSARLEGTYMFPLPEGAHIGRFAMEIDGRMQEAELLDAGKARSIYEEIVRKQRDPALMEYSGRGAFKVRIFPIEPNSPKQIKIRYTQVLKSERGLSEYVYPLNTEKFSARPLREVVVKARVKTDRPIKTIYCPTHEVEIRRDGESSVTAVYEERNARPDRDFRLIFTQDSKPVDLRLLTYRPSGKEGGYFMLMASPGIDRGQQIQARDICFVADTSGSMSGEKIRQLRKALHFCIDNLNAEDRFEVIRFSTEAESLWDEPRQATRENREAAEAFVDSFKPIGGTAIEEALRRAVKMRRGRADSGRPYIVVFLTDGQPTVGETKEDRLVDLVEKDSRTRIFTFGIGDDINTHLLDRIAEKTSAFTTYVAAKEDLELKLSGFFTGIQAPVLTDVTVDFGGDVRAFDMVPRALPDLFAGQTLHLFGRFRGSGAGRIMLKGQLNGKEVSFSEEVTYAEGAEGDRSREYVAQLWATRRVGWLLDEIRLHGESRELREEVTSLAREFGIVTPYTAYLILEDERQRDVPLERQTLRELSSDSRVRLGVSDVYASARGDSESLAKTGQRGVENARAMQEMKDRSALGPMAAAEPLAKPQTPATAGGGYRVAGNYAQQARIQNGRAFYQNGTVWTDASAQNVALARQQTVRFASDEYFALMRKSADVAAWLSLGSEVDVVVDGILYQIRL